MSKIIYKIFSDGERYPILLNEQNIPDLWTTLFVTSHLRVSHTASAIENTLRSILHLRLWESLEGRDLLSEFENERFLSIEDISSIRDFCLLKKRSVIRYMNMKPHANLIKLNWSAPSKVRAIESVSKRHMAVRLAHIAEYLSFVARLLTNRKENFSILYRSIEEMRSQIKAQTRKVAKKSTSYYDPDSNSPSFEVFEQFMEVTKENNPENPFKNSTVRTRNSLMFEVIYQTGFRSGEVLALKVEHIDFHKKTLSVQRNHDDLSDPRARQPVAKTLSRTISVSDSLIKELRNYIMLVRAKVDGAGRYPFVFVTHKKGAYSGLPISDSSFRNRILAPVINTNKELFGGIKRHGFRHNLNYHLSVRIDTNNEIVRTNPERALRENLSHITEQNEIQIRKLINGWSSNETAQTYNKRFTKEKADLLMRIDMEDQLRQLKNEE